MAQPQMGMEIQGTGAMAANQKVPGFLFGRSITGVSNWRLGVINSFNLVLIIEYLTIIMYDDSRLKKEFMERWYFKHKRKMNDQDRKKHA